LTEARLAELQSVVDSAGDTNAAAMPLRQKPGVRPQGDRQEGRRLALPRFL